MTGDIVARDVPIPSGSPPTMHVKELPSDQCGVIYRLHELTPIHIRHHNGTSEKGSLADLTVGTRVNVWADGVLDSCPGQSTANAVEVLLPGTVQPL